MEPVKFSDVPVEPAEYFVDLSRYAPPFLAEIRELAAIYRSEGYEIGQLQHNIEDIRDQCYVITATWGLARWEEVYGIPTNPSMSYEQRRKKVMAKMQGRGTTTRQMIKEIAALFSGGEVTVTEDNPASLFTVQFIGIRPYDMQAFISTIEEIKPAHLAMGLCERYPEQYTVPVRYENTIHFRMGFYPRGNIRRLILDGGWALDGAGYRLTGYDSMDHIDFCPVQITIRSGIKETVQTAGRFRAGYPVKEQVLAETALGLRLEAAEQVRQETCLSVRTEAQECVRAGGIRVMQVNRLDGRWKLDAKRRLDGGVYTL